jgi:hypothetical protein
MSRASAGISLRYHSRVATLTGDQARFILDGVALPALRAEHPTAVSVVTAIPPDRRLSTASANCPRSA